MVVFTCNNCGESLQKPKVEKHYAFQCKNFKSLTCVDCFKDFKGEEYAAHTKCVTEEERYAAKGTYIGGIVKKGEVKQESWIEMIKSIVDTEKNLKPSVRNLLNTISTCTNVPRKKNKFVNFIKSSSGGRVNFNDVEAVWDVIEKYKINNQPKKVIPQNGKKHKLEENETAPVEKKSKLDNEDNFEKAGTCQDDAIFSFKNTILNILQKKKKISAQKLQKKFLQIYSEQIGESEDIAKTIKKYNKKLKKIPNVVIDEDTVKLLGPES